MNINKINCFTKNRHLGFSHSSLFKSDGFKLVSGVKYFGNGYRFFTVSSPLSIDRIIKAIVVPKTLNSGLGNDINSFEEHKI